MTERKELSSEETDSRLDDFSSRELPPAQRRKKNRNKRRFTDEQVKSLEVIFESETKLEPRKKVQVARELGLQPRQVAIWFQNKRARWKSKQIEKDFRLLKAKFDHLKARFESTKQEKESLLSQLLASNMRPTRKLTTLPGRQQLQELNNVLQRTQEGSNRSGVFSGNSLDIDQPRGDKAAAGFEENPTADDQEGLDHQGVIYSYDDDYKSGYIASLGQEEPEKLSVDDEHIRDALAPPVKWCSFDSGNFFDHPNNNSYWWDSWT